MLMNWKIFEAVEDVAFGAGEFPVRWIPLVKHVWASEAKFVAERDVDFLYAAPLIRALFEAIVLDGIHLSPHLERLPGVGYVADTWLSERKNNMPTTSSF